MTIDAKLPGGKRADAILTDAQGEIELVIQLEGGSKLQNRIEPRAGLPLVVLRAATLADEPQRWRTLREHGMPAWRCRCAGTRSLPVDDDFSLRVIGCPIHLRTDGTQYYARVIEDCGRCAFFVGIGYVGNDRRRIQLRCGYGAPPAERRPAVPRPWSTRISVAKSWLDRNCLIRRGRASCRPCLISTCSRSATSSPTMTGPMCSGSTWCASMRASPKFPAGRR